MKVSVACDMDLRRLIEICRLFGRMSRLHLQGRRKIRAGKGYRMGGTEARSAGEQWQSDPKKWSRVSSVGTECAWIERGKVMVFTVWGEGKEKRRNGGLCVNSWKGMCLWRSGINRGKEGRPRFLNEVEDPGLLYQKILQSSLKGTSRWFPDRRH
jgi:hypothetical protein